MTPTPSKTNKSNGKEARKPAKEIINEFFARLHDIDGMDPDVAATIQRLWDDNKLGRDELLSALKTAREKRGKDESEED